MLIIAALFVLSAGVLSNAGVSPTFALLIIPMRLSASLLLALSLLPISSKKAAGVSPKDANQVSYSSVVSSLLFLVDDFVFWIWKFVAHFVNCLS